MIIVYKFKVRGQASLQCQAISTPWNRSKCLHLKSRSKIVTVGDNKTLAAYKYFSISLEGGLSSGAEFSHLCGPAWLMEVGLR